MIEKTVTNFKEKKKLKKIVQLTNNCTQCGNVKLKENEIDLKITCTMSQK